jgi:LmbE family N-acetylglucosaminyl deacetylase
MIKYLQFVVALVSAQLALAQTSPELSSAEILQDMKKLGTTGSVLYIAAHPDDENTRLLAWLAREKNLRTGYLSLTRGDGGQNLVGSEQGEALGVIRTQELLAARRTDGAEQFFTRANDFGFSKNPEETFTIWNRDSILADVVWTIRKFRPDVIICRFPTTGEGGHGHHTASAILALEAFDLAADPTKFPEQLQQTQVWQVKRIFWNTFNFGGNNTTAPDQLTVDVGTYNPLLGLSYGEVAANSRSMHKSQGFGSARQRGENTEYFKFLRGAPAGKDLFEGIDCSWNRVPGAADLDRLIAACVAGFDPRYPERSLPALEKIDSRLQQLDEKDTDTRYWKQLKTEACRELMLQCAGLWMEAYAADYSAVPGNPVKITAQVIARNPSAVVVKSVTFMEQVKKLDLTLTVNRMETIEQTETLPVSAAPSAPYWLTKPHTIGMYEVNDRTVIGMPENSPAAQVVYRIAIDGTEFEVVRGLVYKWTDPVKGEVYRPFEILPPVTINMSDNVLVFADKTPKTVMMTVKAHMPDVKGTVKLSAPAGWTVTLENPEIDLAGKGGEQVVKATLIPGKDAQAGQLSAMVAIGANTYANSMMRIEYDHIPYQFILGDARAKIVVLDLAKKGSNKIGYIPGAGDNIPACLAQIGYEVTLLTDELLAKEDLGKYAAIVTGIRAYNTNDRLPVYYDKLMAYVQQGGNLIVQYNTNNRVAPMETRIGPYPFTISRDRVTDDNAKVEFTAPEHPVLNKPNVITEEDFEGWVQERGIYFATQLDEHYQTVLSMHDPNEPDHSGSLIVAPYGKGNFVYTGLVFFRELPAGVPGAYRLFVNLLSLPPNKSPQ